MRHAIAPHFNEEGKTLEEEEEEQEGEPQATVAKFLESKVTYVVSKSLAV